MYTQHPTSNNIELQFTTIKFQPAKQKDNVNRTRATLTSFEMFSCEITNTKSFNVYEDYYY